MDVFDIVKAKLPKPMEEPELALYIAEVGQSIKTYINSSRIPKELDFVYANMVIDLIKGEQRKLDPDSQQTVSSIREGDTTVQYGSAKVESRERATEQLLFDYAKQLNKFRKLRW